MKTWLKLVCCLMFLAGCLAGGEDPLDRPVDLDLMGKSLAQAVLQLSERSDLTVMVGADVAKPTELAKVQLQIEARGLPLRRAAEWLARALGTRYRVAANGRALWLTSAYDWLPPATTHTKIHNLGGLVNAEERPAFKAKLDELIKTCSLFEPQYNMQIMPSDGRLLSVMPQVLQDRLEQALALMNEGGRPLPPPAGDAGASGPSPAKLLSVHVFTPKNATPLPRLLTVLAAQAGLNLACEHAPFRESGWPNITLKEGEIELGACLKEICTQAGLSGWEFDPPDGFWLVARKDCRERVGDLWLSWEDAGVAGYAVPGLMRTIGGEMLAFKARRAIHPETRSDPNFAIVPYEAKGMVLVSGTPKSIAQVAAFLAGQKEEPEPAGESSQGAK